jgi:hypothetical protein
MKRIAVFGALLLAIVAGALWWRQRHAPESPRPAPPPARITELAGSVKVERGASAFAAAAGTALAFDDRVHTGPGGRARIVFASGASLALGENALLRLGRDADQSPVLSLELGDAALEAAPAEGAPLKVTSPRGPMRLTPGARIRVRAARDETRLEVLFGRAELAAGDGAAPLPISAGEGLRLSIGGAVVERYHIELGPTEVEKAGPTVTSREAPAPTAVPPPAAPVPAPQSAEAETEEAHDLALAIGESSTIHAERPPVLVRLVLPEGCPARTAALRGLPKRVPVRPRGALALGFALPKGTFSYRLRCADREVGRATMTVLADHAVATLPRRPPRNHLEADGRRYTVLFQNHLPAFFLSWPRAPKGPYTLHVESRGGRKTWSAREAKRELTSGTLDEGDHRWWWTAEGGRSSPTTELSLRFDNAAIAAEIRLPRPNQAKAAASGRIEVAGTTVPGSRARAAGQALAVDAQGRFAGEVLVPRPPARALDIVIEHRRGGVHHYLRRLTQH